MNSLPNEIIYTILNFITDEKDILNCSEINKTFYYIIVNKCEDIERKNSAHTFACHLNQTIIIKKNIITSRLKNLFCQFHFNNPMSSRVILENILSMEELPQYTKTLPLIIKKICDVYGLDKKKIYFKEKIEKNDKQGNSYFIKSIAISIDNIEEQMNERHPTKYIDYTCLCKLYIKLNNRY